MSQFVENRLRRFQDLLSDTEVFDSGPKSAFGQRLLELTDIFHRELLEDEVIVFYLDELADACETQLDLIERIGSDEELEIEFTKILDYLKGVLNLVQEFETLERSQLEADVHSLEAVLASALLDLSTEETT